jgi:hypothetical protein
LPGAAGKTVQLIVSEQVCNYDAILMILTVLLICDHSNGKSINEFLSALAQILFDGLSCS